MNVVHSRGTRASLSARNDRMIATFPRAETRSILIPYVKQPRNHSSRFFGGRGAEGYQRDSEIFRCNEIINERRYYRCSFSEFIPRESEHP